MTDLGSAIVGLAIGLAVGVVIVAARRGGHGAQDLSGASRLEARLEVQASDLRRLADAVGVRDALAERLHEEVAGARRALHDLSISERERKERDREAWTVVRRLSTVLAGGPAQGRAGENVLRQHLTQLPPGILVTDFKVNGKVVEFGLLLPDGRRLPVDSKWSALAELEALEAVADPGELDARARDVERVVANRAREVAQYLDPALTAPVAVAAVPDAAYAVLKRAHADAFTKGVVIVPYSTALPVLLFLYSLVGRFGDTGDVQAVLSEVGSLLDAMEGILENKIARAATMIGNGADEFRSQLGKARGSVSRARAGGGAEPPRAVAGATADVLHALP
ncbi:MAG TPA: DNA recombination protein RmuC [Actinomycetota bacterium]|nr:DNA recombination protein RmuC [Actinomycetota bacterium]